MPLTSTSLVYKGAFKVPTEGAGELVLSYGGTALAFNPATNTLFIVGHDHTQCIAEISIPTPKIGALSTLNRATMIQNPRAVSVQTNGNLQGEIKIGGLHIHNGNLIGTRYEYYDADGNGRPSHWKLNGTNLNQTAQGLYELSSPGGGWVGGAIADIPASKRSLFGNKTHVCGIAGLAIVSRASSGPCAFAFNAADLGVVSPVTTVPMVGYPLDTPLGGDPRVVNNLYNYADSVFGMVFPDSDTLLCFGVHGKGPYCYGAGSTCGDLRDGYQGGHGYPYVPFVWAYAVSDLADVAAGRKQMHQITPVTWELTEFKTMPRYGTPAAYDAVNKRIYLVEIGGDTSDSNSPYPLIHVYDLNLGTTPPADTTAPFITNITSTPAQVDSVVSWTTNEASDTQVEYGTTTAYGSSTTLNTSMVTTHAVTLRSLTAGTTYNFRVKSKDAAGNLATSPNNQFTTQAATPTTVRVTNISQLTSAVNNLKTGQTISLAPGTYLSTTSLSFPANVSNITVIGDDRDSVILDGNNTTLFGFWLSTNQNVTFKNMTIQRFAQHGIVANYGAHGLRCENLRMEDINDQFIKSNPSTTVDVGNDNGVVIGCLIGYTTNAPDEYTNGVDIHSGKNWTVTNNTFYNILHPTLLCGPAILAWNHSQGTTVKGNKFINCARDISLGLILRSGTSDHVGGLVCNNTSIRNKVGTYDVPVGIMDSSGTIVLHNTIICGSSYPNAIEYRFARTTGVIISANLTDKPIVARDSAVGTIQNNQTNANVSLFVDPNSGDLHLKAGITSIQTVTKSSLVPDDMDATVRSTTTLVGADEIPVTVNPCQSYIDQLATANANIATLTSQLNSANEQITTLTNQLTASNAQITTLNNQITSLQNQVTSLTNQLNLANTSIASLTQQLQNLQNDNDSLLVSNAALNTQNQLLSNKLSDIKNSLTILADSI